jgi:DNA mismatch endonuclease (patch repair protein)
MADVFNRQTRSRIMSRIRSRDTEPEKAVRSFLHSQCLRFRLHLSSLPGRPDIVLPRFRTVIFVHGCFWHQHEGCLYAVMPKTNRAFWKAKLKENMRRDLRNAARVRRAGWRVLTIWECSLGERDLERLYRRIRSPLTPTQHRLWRAH